jgi:hypothetical protein
MRERYESDFCFVFRFPCWFVIIDPLFVWLVVCTAPLNNPTTQQPTIFPSNDCKIFTFTVHYKKHRTPHIPQDKIHYLYLVLEYGRKETK